MDLMIALLYLSTVVVIHCKLIDLPNYCNHPDCSVNGQHTLCSAGHNVSSRLYVSGMTDWMRSQILLMHNRHRDTVASGLETDQPSATNMRKMYWDDELETIAEAWARQCQNRHDECRNTLRFNVLQNMDVRTVVSHMTMSQLLSDAVGSWFSGARLLQRDRVQYFRLDNCSAPCGCNAHRYAAAAWASTWRLGCSIALCLVKKEFCTSEEIGTKMKKFSVEPYLNRTVETPKSVTKNLIWRGYLLNSTVPTNIREYPTVKGYKKTNSALYRGALEPKRIADPPKDNRLVAYTVCNYGPAGNIEGLQIYDPGAPCSKCPLGTRCADAMLRALCALSEDPEIKHKHS